MKSIKRLFLVISLILSFGFVSCCTMNIEAEPQGPQYIDFSIQNIGSNDVHFMFFNKVTKNIDQIVDIPKNKVAYFYDFQRDMDTYEYSLITYKDDTKSFAGENIVSCYCINTFISNNPWPKGMVKVIKVDATNAPKNHQYSFCFGYVPKNPQYK